MSRSPNPALSAALASHELPVGHNASLNDWHGIDIACPNGDTLRFAAETGDPYDPLNMHRLTSAGVLCWTVRFDGGTPPQVIAAAAVAALEAQP